jgi:hypothetical protein
MVLYIVRKRTSTTRTESSAALDVVVGKQFTKSIFDQLGLVNE